MGNTYAGGIAPTILRRGLGIFAAVLLVMGLVTSLVHAETNSVERSESVVLHTGEWFSVSSNRESLQLVEIRGNLSATKFSSPSRYPTNSFNFTSYVQGHYSIRLTCSYPSEYDATISVWTSSGARQEEASYYVSSGQLLLTIDLDFKAPDPVSPIASSSPWDSFVGWTARFGDAFPLWVKLLYLLLGVQFVAVGYKWIRFENCAREDDSAASRFDRGNLVYLWSEIFWKFLLTVFLVIAAAMGGHLILVSVLRFMFLAQVNILSLWDLFVLGFAAGIAAIAYVFKLCLEKSFDLKPLLQD
jgi:hypothetical protein